MEKEFDLIKVLQDTREHLGNDELVLSGRKVMLDEIIDFIQKNKLKVTQTVEEKVEEVVAE